MGRRISAHGLGLDLVHLVSGNGCMFFLVCMKTVVPNWPVDISEIKEEDVSDEEVTGLQELPSELPAADLAEHNGEGTADDAVPEDASASVASPYKWVVEAANYLCPTSVPALNEALDMIESVSSTPLLLQLVVGDLRDLISTTVPLSELAGSPCLSP